MPAVQLPIQGGSAHFWFDTGDGTIGSPYRVYTPGPHTFTSNLTLDTAAYADGDVFSDLLTLTGSVYEAGRHSYLTSLTVNDKSDQGIGIEFHFFTGTITLQAKNAAWNVSDADMDKCFLSLLVTGGDILDIGPNRQAPFSGLHMPFTPDSGTSIYLATRIRGVGTYAADGVRVRVGFERY